MSTYTSLPLVVLCMLTVGGDTVIQKGTASYYHEGQKVSCGGKDFNPYAMTAAHRKLPCGTKVKVTNHVNGKSVIVTINDRGPYIDGRVIDLSKGAAAKIDMLTAGLVPVTISRVLKG